MSDTKLKGDIAETKVILEGLKRGWGVSTPVGDRLPYDLVLDVDGKLLKIQVKSAWFYEKDQNWICDNRRSQTNRKEYKVSAYTVTDFDFCVVYLDEIETFYVFPSNVFISYGSGISMVEDVKRQRKPKSHDYRDAWHLIE